MSIFDIASGTETDKIGKLLGLNSRLGNKEGDLYEYLNNPLTKGIRGVDNNGQLQAEMLELRAVNHNFDFTELQSEGLVNSIKCSELHLGHFPLVDPSVTTSKILTAQLFIDGCTLIKDVDIVVDKKCDSTRHTQTPSRAAVVMAGFGKKCSFDNASIMFYNQEYDPLIRCEGSRFFDLNGLKSNVKIYHQYTLDDFPSEIMKIFQSDWSCEIYDVNKGADVKIPVKNMKKAVAIANNHKRYKLKNHILDLRHGAKFSDIVSTKLLPDLIKYTIKNSNVALNFIKENSKYCFSYSGSFIRCPQDSQPNAHSTQNYMDRSFPKTADGWYVVWQKL